MKTAIHIRDHMMRVVAATFPEVAADHIVSQKLDAVDVFPFIAISLEDMESEPAAMRGCNSRTQTIVVVLYREAELNDLEAAFANDCHNLETKVEEERRKKSDTAFGADTSMHLSNARMTFPPDSEAKRGALVMTFSARYESHL